MGTKTAPIAIRDPPGALPLIPFERTPTLRLLKQAEGGDNPT